MFNQSGVWELEVDIGMSLTVYQPSVLSQSLLLSLDLTISARLAGQGAPRDPPATTSQHWDHRQVSSPLVGHGPWGVKSGPQACTAST